MKLNTFSRISTFVLFLSLLSLAVSADNITQEGFDPTTSFEWLINHCDAGHCEDTTSDIMATAFYAMAMKSSGYSNSYGLAAADYLISQKHEQNSCFPKSNCNVKDTAFAYWALSNYGEDTSGIEDYIKSKLAAGLKESWWLEIITNAENKTCTIGYPYDGAMKQQDIRVDQGTFPDCQEGQPETYFDLNDCLETNLVNLNPAIEFTIDCSNIGTGTKIAIVYNSGSEFFLTEEATTAKYQTSIQNACHTSGSACDKETSLWTNWILHTQRSDLSTNLYLFTEYDNLAPIDTSLLYLSSDEKEELDRYSKELIDLQRLDGSFNTNNFQTAIAIMALHASASTEEVSNAIDYLEKSVKSDGSWDGNVLTTAAVLYIAFSGASVNLPPMGSLGPAPDTGSFCGDGICDFDETVYSCSADCAEDTICIVNGKCETNVGENSDNCPLDCQPYIPEEQDEICGNDLREGFEECDGFDDSGCPPNYYCTSQCTCAPEFEPVEEKNSFAWIISIVIVILFIILAYLVYTKYLQKHGKSGKPYSHGPSMFGSSPGTSRKGYSTPQRRYPPVKPKTRGSKKTKSEMDLEKSLEEARKLLGKK